MEVEILHPRAHAPKHATVESVTYHEVKDLTAACVRARALDSRFSFHHLVGRGQCYVKEHFASWKLFSGQKARSYVHGMQSNDLTLTIDLSGSTRSVFRRKNDRMIVKGIFLLLYVVFV